MCQHAHTRFKPDYFVPYSLHSAVNKRLRKFSSPHPTRTTEDRETERERDYVTEILYTLLPVLIIAAGLDAAQLVSLSSATPLLFPLMSFIILCALHGHMPFISLPRLIRGLFLRFLSPHLVSFTPPAELTEACCSFLNKNYIYCWSYTRWTPTGFERSNANTSLKRIIQTNAWEQAVTSLFGPLHQQLLPEEQQNWLLLCSTSATACTNKYFGSVIDESVLLVEATPIVSNTFVSSSHLCKKMYASSAREVEIEIYLIEMFNYNEWKWFN